MKGRVWECFSFNLQIWTNFFSRTNHRGWRTKMPTIITTLCIIFQMCTKFRRDCWILSKLWRLSRCTYKLSEGKKCEWKKRERIFREIESFGGNTTFYGKSIASEALIDPIRIPQSAIILYWNRMRKREKQKTISKDKRKRKSCKRGKKRRIPTEATYVCRNKISSPPPFVPFNHHY